jgi:hypothetical protein
MRLHVRGSDLVEDGDTGSTGQWPCVERPGTADSARVAACGADIRNNKQWNPGFNYVMGMRRLSLMRGQLRASRLSIDAQVFCCADWRSAGWQDFNSICFREELSPRREFKFGAKAKELAAIITGKLNGT